VLQEEGRREIVFLRYLKNSKTEWIEINSDSEGPNVTFKYDKIKGVITYNSLRNSVVPKSRMVLPYEFVEKDKHLKIRKYVVLSFSKRI
jgi:hypothetical protein